MEKILTFFEKQAFGVCGWWGEKLGIKSSRIRLYFIYFSFITLGSPLIIYLIMAFFLEHKDLVKQLVRGRRKTVWDL
ncbi:MAG: PspC family transcriptional regulator [Flavobacteriales bacterium]|nr:MAG: PspC family transcriptional regulator [Flavobacteriales bacterium]